MNATVAAFLEANGLGEHLLDTEKLLADFAAEMEAGLAGRASSLPMIPAYLTTDAAVPADQPVIVLDAGGTHLRVGVVRFDAAGRPAISRFTRHRMPGTEAPLTADAFFNTLADTLMPVIAEADRIGFCFSYRAEITPDGDGRLLRWSKQIQAPEVEGRLVGAELNQRLAARGHPRRITVLNDTVAALLAGKSAGMARRYGDYVGYILGTGTNTACVVGNAAIGKLPGLDPRGHMIVNIESGGFGRAPRSRFDEAFDATTLDPGAYAFEKMISGGYLGGLGLTVLQAAAREGLLSAACGQAILAWPRLENKDLDDFCDNPFLASGPFAAVPLTDDDRRAVQAMGQALYRRAARLSAVNLAAVILAGGRGADPLAPVCVNVDGSTFYRTRSAAFRSRIEEHLRAMLEPRGIHYERVGVEDAPVIGAAVAGLTRPS
ncbi:MAG: hexokinase [Lentisphaerae bacterium]|nr:hexokinase [Lentisphaerota bacterium]